MKDKEDKGELANVVSPEDQSQAISQEKEESVLCEIGDKSGRPACCGPGDLSKISTPVVRKKSLGSE